MLVIRLVPQLCYIWFWSHLRSLTFNFVIMPAMFSLSLIVSCVLSEWPLVSAKPSPLKVSRANLPQLWPLKAKFCALMLNTQQLAVS